MSSFLLNVKISYSQLVVEVAINKYSTQNKRQLSIRLIKITQRLSILQRLKHRISFLVLFESALFLWMLLLKFLNLKTCYSKFIACVLKIILDIIRNKLPFLSLKLI